MSIWGFRWSLTLSRAWSAKRGRSLAVKWGTQRWSLSYIYCKNLGVHSTVDFYRLTASPWAVDEGKLLKVIHLRQQLGGGWVVIRLGVSRTIYVNVDSPNLVFPYFNFLGEAQCIKTPCIFRHLYLFKRMQLVSDETITQHWKQIKWFHRVFACDIIPAPNLMQLILDSIKSCRRQVIAFWCCFHNIFRKLQSAHILIHGYYER